MKNKKKSFCKGVLCKERDRKFICIECKVNVCSLCSVKEGEKQYCINCYLGSFMPHWDKLNNEFDEMLMTLKLIKFKKTNKKTYIRW